MIAQHQSSVPFRLHGNWQVLGTEWGQAHFTVASVQNFFSVMFRLQLVLTRRRPSRCAQLALTGSPLQMVICRYFPSSYACHHLPLVVLCHGIT